MTKYKRDFVNVGMKVRTLEKNIPTIYPPPPPE